MKKDLSHSNQIRPSSGFSLVEIIVVLVLVGLLGLGVNQFTRTVGQFAKKTNDRNQKNMVVTEAARVLNYLRTSISVYRFDPALTIATDDDGVFMRTEIDRVGQCAGPAPLCPDSMNNSYTLQQMADEISVQNVSVGAWKQALREVKGVDLDLIPGFEANLTALIPAASSDLQDFCDNLDSQMGANNRATTSNLVDELEGFDSNNGICNVLNSYPLQVQRSANRYCSRRSEHINFADNGGAQPADGLEGISRDICDSNVAVQPNVSSITLGTISSVSDIYGAVSEDRRVPPLEMDSYSSFRGSFDFDSYEMEIDGNGIRSNSNKIHFSRCVPNSLGPLREQNLSLDQVRNFKVPVITAANTVECCDFGGSTNPSATFSSCVGLEEERPTFFTMLSGEHFTYLPKDIDRELVPGYALVFALKLNEDQTEITKDFEFMEIILENRCKQMNVRGICTDTKLGATDVTPDQFAQDVAVSIKRYPGRSEMGVDDSSVIRLGPRAIRNPAAAAAGAGNGGSGTGESNGGAGNAGAGNGGTGNGATDGSSNGSGDGSANGNVLFGTD